MCAEQQDHFPFRPVTDSIHLTEDDAKENDLAAEPEDFHDHPEKEVRLEAQLADKRVAQHDSPNLKVAPHPEALSRMDTETATSRHCCGCINSNTVNRVAGQ